MGERLRRLGDRFRRRSGVSVVRPEEIGEKAADLALGARDIKMVVNARAGNPLFDILPTVLEQTPPNVQVELVLMGSPDDMRRDERTMEILRRVSEIMERKSASSIKAFPTEEMGEAEIEATQLELEGNPEFDYLAVFVQDPEKKDQYWFRKVGVETGTLPEEHGGIPYIDVRHVDLGKYNHVPVPEKGLRKAVEAISRVEEKLGRESALEIAALRATVGIARYTGGKELSLDSATMLAALKYHRLRTAK